MEERWNSEEKSKHEGGNWKRKKQQWKGRRKKCKTTEKKESEWWKKNFLLKGFQTTADKTQYKLWM